jgi:hypothetical protein
MVGRPNLWQSHVQSCRALAKERVVVFFVDGFHTTKCHIHNVWWGALCTSSRQMVGKNERTCSGSRRQRC